MRVAVRVVFGVTLLNVGCFEDPGSVNSTQGSDTTADTTGSASGGTTTSGATSDASLSSSTGGSTSGTSSTTGAEVTSGSTSATAGATSEEDGSTTAGPGSESQTAADSGSTSSDGEDSLTEGPDPGDSSESGPSVHDFFDDFERSNSDVLGFGWVEKDPLVFRLIDGEVGGQLTDTYRPYYEQIAVQPLAVADIELQVEFRITAPDGSNRPSLVARMSPESSNFSSFLTGYLFEPQPEEGQLCVMRFNSLVTIGGGPTCRTFCDAAGTDACLAVGTHYRLTFRVEGENPVELYGSLEALSENVWQPLGQVSWTDSAPTRLAGPGTWGFGAGESGAQVGNYRYDNFHARFLGE